MERWSSSRESGAPSWRKTLGTALRAIVLLLTVTAPGSGSAADLNAVLMEKENEVDYQRGQGAWTTAAVGLKLAVRDKVKTGVLSRAVIRLSDLTMVRVNQISRVVITAGGAAGRSPSVDVEVGGLYLFSRERTPEIEIKGPAASGALHGTQFSMQVMPNGRTVLSVLEGEVLFYNQKGRVMLRSGDQGTAEVGEAPRKTSVIEAINVIQWALYYPAVVDPGKLGLTSTEQSVVARSLSAYREGDLLGALERYPHDYRPSSRAARLYKAAVVLCVGQVEEAERLLAEIPASAPGFRAIEQMIAVVNFRDWANGSGEPGSASDWLAESYYRQSKSDPGGALRAGRRATELSPEFGYTWTRLAELEFSAGRTRPALQALGRGLKLTPRNAQAHALRGFLLSAQNSIPAAREAFDRAINLDGALGNGWLGRGLTYIRQGDSERGRIDLQVAATMEPNRSILHAYLGKAFSQNGEIVNAHRDLERAKELDPHDPTPWLYSAIQHEQENRYNESVRDLEKSLTLNENRRVYRSRFLLDQDRAVRSANLAAIFQKNGMPEVAVREATRAVDEDYASAGGHLFLANAFNGLRDPNRILLRNETSWFNELLIANLLSPVGGGPLSEYVSQQEYSKLFEGDGLGFFSMTDYYSSGELRETASQFGTFGNVSYALDTEYLYNDGTRPNNEISRVESYATFKLQLGPEDTVFLQAKYQDLQSGDLFQRYDPRAVESSRAARTLDFREQQEPGLALLGWHHEWNPGAHTVLLGGRLSSEQSLRAKGTNQTLVGRDITSEFPTSFSPPPNFDPSQPLRTTEVLDALGKLTGRGNIYGIGSDQFDFDRVAKFEIYSGELNQILTLGPSTLVFGGRYQSGSFDTYERLDKEASDSAENHGGIGSQYYQDPAADQRYSVGFDRFSLYAYDFWRVASWLTITAGVSYDKLKYPDNFRSPPINNKEVETEKILPKAGFIWQPHSTLVVRGAYSQGLSGVSFDESIRLEPTQLAGFTQASRTYISEDIIGSVAGATIETWGLSVEQKLPTSTYWGAEYNVIKEDLDRTVGVFDLLRTDSFPEVFGVLPSSLQQKLAYREDTLTFTINQLIGDRWSVGTRYRYARSTLQSSFGSLKEAVADLSRAPGGGDAGVKASLKRVAEMKEASVLHELSLFANYNSPSGFFARAEVNWYSQENDGFPKDATKPRNDSRPGDDFWQCNLYAGWRFFRNQCEVSVGLLNLNGSDYQLEPLSYYVELPRERTFFTRVKIAF